MESTIASYISNKIKNFGINYVFGVPGSYIMPLWQEIAKNTKIVLGCHESGAGFMADGYSRGTNNISILLTTSGPGLTNAITAITNAYMDSIPMIIISGNVKTDLIGHGSFQECSRYDRSFNQMDLVKSITKFQVEITNSENAEFLINNAFNIAISGRKGPVFISIPVDMQTKRLKLCEMNEDKMLSNNDYFINEYPFVVKQINNSQRPIIYAGWGVFQGECISEIIKLSKLINAPIISTMKGKSCCCDNTQLYLGHVGFGTIIDINKFLAEYNPDLILALGTSFSLRSIDSIESFLNRCNMISINIENANIYRNRSIEIVGNMKSILLTVIKKIKKKNDDFNISQKVKLLQNNRNQIINELIDKNNLSMSSSILLLNKYTNENTVFFPDSGNNWLDCLSLLDIKNYKLIITMWRSLDFIF